MNFCVHVDQYALRGKSLRAVRGYGVTVIEVAHLARVERYCLPAVHADGELPILADVLDGCEGAVSDAKLPVGRSELEPVADGKLALDLAVGADAAQPRRVIAHLFAVCFLNDKAILFRVGCDHLSIAARLDANVLAPSLVTLQGVGRDTGIAELLRGARGGGKAFHRIAALLSSAPIPASAWP